MITSRRPRVLAKAEAFLFLACSLLLVLACNDDSAVNAERVLSDYPLVPIPAQITDLPGGLELATIAGFRAEGNIDGAALVAAVGSNIDARLQLLANEGGEGAVIELVNANELAPEGYRLEVLPAMIRVVASDAAGHFYGLQTLRQLWREATVDGDGVLALGAITDQPRYAYRGIMLDVARHFHQPEEVRRLIDLMALYKLNALHLHLTDDQGWRIEIDAYPKLTTYGGSTQVGGNGGGFYTKAVYRELVAYAAEHHIIVVPEIDMPGHTNAALASYPELTCDGVAPELYEGTKVGFSTLCVGKPEVETFVKTILEELAELTPAPYLHIGGDESWATDSLDYLAFIKMTEPMVRAVGKRMMGWDEVVMADIDRSAVVQLWHKKENATLAAERGHKLIMSPAEVTYLDMQYDSTSRIGLHWASYIEVDAGYTWDPTTIMGGISDDNILGIEAPLWSETVVTRADIDYLTFPRLLGYAEIGWSPADKRDWDTYKVRLAEQGDVLEELGVDFYRSETVDWSGDSEVMP